MSDTSWVSSLNTLRGSGNTRPRQLPLGAARGQRFSAGSLIAGRADAEVGNRECARSVQIEVLPVRWRILREHRIGHPLGEAGQRHPGLGTRQWRPEAVMDACPETQVVDPLPLRVERVRIVRYGSIAVCGSKTGGKTRLPAPISSSPTRSGCLTTVFKPRSGRSCLTRC